MATLYIWKKSRKRKSVGHVSLYVHHTKDYISWWPTQSKSKFALKQNKISVKEDLPKTYDEDKNKYMKREAKYIYVIERDCIDCNAIICKWQYIIYAAKYHLFSKNCATVVMEVLEAGALCLKYRPKPYSVCTPGDVQKYGKQLHQLERREKLCCIEEEIVRSHHRRKYNCFCGGLFEQGECVDHLCTGKEICMCFCMCLLFLCFVAPCVILYDYLKEMCCSHRNDTSRSNSDLQIV